MHVGSVLIVDAGLVRLTASLIRGIYAGQDSQFSGRLTDYAKLRRISGDVDPNNIPKNDQLCAESVTLFSGLAPIVCCFRRPSSGCIRDVECSGLSAVLGNPDLFW